MHSDRSCISAYGSDDKTFQLVCQKKIFLVIFSHHVSLLNNSSFILGIFIFFIIMVNQGRPTRGPRSIF